MPLLFAFLQNESDITLKAFNDLSASETFALYRYDNELCGYHRESWIVEWMKHCNSETVVALDSTVRV